MSRRALIIDDEPGIRDLVTKSLELAGGWQVFAAGSAEEGITLAATHELDVVLLDFMMPDLDGLTTLGEIRSKAHTPEVPVIFLTGKAPALIDGCHDEHGLAGVIEKPFDLFALPEQIVEQLDAG